MTEKRTIKTASVKQLAQVFKFIREQLGRSGNVDIIDGLPYAQRLVKGQKLARLLQSILKPKKRKLLEFITCSNNTAKSRVNSGPGVLMVRAIGVRIATANKLLSTCVWGPGLDIRL